MSLIYRDPVTRSNLYQCGKLEIPDYLRTKPIDLVIFAAAESQPRFSNTSYLHVPMQDKAAMSKSELKNTIAMATKGADAVAEAILDGKHILCTCIAGWNRSGLVSALALKQLLNLPAKQIIGLIQDRRMGSLYNPLFHEIIINY